MLFFVSANRGENEVGAAEFCFTHSHTTRSEIAHTHIRRLAARNEIASIHTRNRNRTHTHTYTHSPTDTQNGNLTCSHTVPTHTQNANRTQSRTKRKAHALTPTAPTLTQNGDRTPFAVGVECLRLQMCVCCVMLVNVSSIVWGCFGNHLQLVECVLLLMCLLISFINCNEAPGISQKG